MAYEKEGWPSRSQDPGARSQKEKSNVLHRKWAKVKGKRGPAGAAEREKGRGGGGSDRNNKYSV